MWSLLAVLVSEYRYGSLYVCVKSPLSGSRKYCFVTSSHPGMTEMGENTALPQSTESVIRFVTFT